MLNPSIPLFKKTKSSPLQSNFTRGKCSFPEIFIWKKNISIEDFFCFVGFFAWLWDGVFLFVFLFLLWVSFFFLELNHAFSSWSKILLSCGWEINFFLLCDVLSSSLSFALLNSTHQRMLFAELWYIEWVSSLSWKCCPISSLGAFHGQCCNSYLV